MAQTLPAPVRGDTHRSRRRWSRDDTRYRDDTDPGQCRRGANDWSSILGARFGGIECGYGELNRKTLKCLMHRSVLQAKIGGVFPIGKRVLEATVADEMKPYLARFIAANAVRASSHSLP